ncbi:hypothetical protein PYCCODRAFT_822805 [Trametes coccinea BRFM310]|uniref:Uncharacterized protein n=1 Tax=Trametes coccinea (strain BRFM310) TaxID=1353009 RepID=A0A1Y2IEM0_TRAC3|nr:hypothetical protein PYCCODRAFT_822805 [Trametes coccinea BRFM310]
MHSRTKASDRTRSSDNLHHRPSPRQRALNSDVSPTGGARYLRDDLPREPRNSHHHGDEVDRKGKRRADDRADASDVPSRPDPSREEETTTASGSVRAGMQSNVNTRPPSHASSRDDPPSSSAVSTPPYCTDQSGPIAQNANDQSKSAASPVATSVNDTDRAKSPGHPASKTGKDELPGGSPKSRSEGRPPVRIRRNPWQAMQQYLADGAGGSRPTSSKDTTSGSELPSTAQSQAQRDAAVNPRDKALRPEDPSPPGEAVPSLLLRLSDPVPPASATSRNPSSRVPDATRAYPLVHEDGKRITASEMIGRTRATSDKPTTAVEIGAGPSRTPRVQHSGTVRESQQSPRVVGGSDVSAVEQMSSENAARPGGTLRNHHSCILRKLTARFRTH